MATTHIPIHALAEDGYEVVLFHDLRTASRYLGRSLPPVARLPPALRSQLIAVRKDGERLYTVDESVTRPRRAVPVAGLCAWLPVQRREDKAVVFHVLE